MPPPLIQSRSRQSHAIIELTTAYLYVRQSSLRQVFENTESTQRQYGLREQAVALGWPLDRIIVIDSDLGLSGASSDREGFRRLVTEVSLAHVGIVLGLEVSRLARNSTDWHRLLEICALTDTLILDEERRQTETQPYKYGPELQVLFATRRYLAASPGMYRSICASTSYHSQLMEGQIRVSPNRH